MMPKLWCFKGAKKFNYLFFYFLLGLLFCKLLCSGFGELVLVMECNPSCSMDNLYDQCESWFLGMIGAELSRERGEVDKQKPFETG